jgi:hypothetical protein
MPTDDRKFSNESEKSATQREKDEQIQDLPERTEKDKATRDEEVKGGMIRQREDLY